MRGTVLVVDDDRSMCEMLEMDLTRRGFKIRWEISAEKSFDLFMREAFDAVLTDLHLPEMGGIALCERMAANHPDIPVIVITAFGSMDTAIDALRAGAYDFVSKPIDTEQLALVLDRAVKHHSLLDRIEFLNRAVEEIHQFENIVGTSPAMARVINMVKRISDLESTVLITGESGTGKELVARALHNLSHRKEMPFVAINCTAVPESLLENELFGHTGGAFTDGRKARDGLFVQAGGGTLLLDEIGDMPLTLQPKILRTLEQRTVRPIGGDKELPFDVRIIAATNHDPELLLEKGKLREDLYYRLNVIQIELPPLRERENDVILLAEHFLAYFVATTGKKINGIATPVKEKLLEYDWPGNIRELRNSIERAVALTTHEKIVVENLPEKIRAYRKKSLNVDTNNPSELISMEGIERRYIEYVLNATGGNKSKAANVLGFDRKTLYRKMEKYSISPEDDK